MSVKARRPTTKQEGHGQGWGKHRLRTFILDATARVESRNREQSKRIAKTKCRFDGGEMPSREQQAGWRCEVFQLASVRRRLRRRR